MEAEPGAETDWDPGPDQGEHAFFAGDDDDDSEDPGRGAAWGDWGRGGRKPKKRRSGCACLVVTLVFGGGLAGVGYFGYQFYQDRFGAAPTTRARARGTSSSTSRRTPAAMRSAASSRRPVVVKSVDAFVSAQGKHPQGQTIQSGVYTLKKGMSAANAVELMLSPKSRSNFIIPEGSRNSGSTSRSTNA
ncbi:Endolytic murein transglycosylase OS=Streptomyces alboniger OX=132473 GN=mltG PE=3 SV=1 [Streptomyces alboniger]